MIIEVINAKIFLSSKDYVIRKKNLDLRIQIKNQKGQNRKIQLRHTYLNGVSPGFLWRVTCSNCLPFFATKFASLSATFFTEGSLGGEGAACHLNNGLIPGAWKNRMLTTLCSSPCHNYFDIFQSTSLPTTLEKELRHKLHWWEKKHSRMFLLKDSLALKQIDLLICKLPSICSNAYK